MIVGHGSLARGTRAHQLIIPSVTRLTRPLPCTILRGAHRPQPAAEIAPANPDAGASAAVEAAGSPAPEASPAPQASDDSCLISAVETCPREPPSVANLPPPPTGLGAKQRLSDADYARKVEGGYFTGLPLANFDRDTGFGFGARVYYFVDGKKDNPLFAYTPYLQRVFAQAFATTSGAQFHWLDYDAPSFLGSLFRVRAGLIFAQNITQNYFGTGARSLGTLSYPGEMRTFAKGGDYDTATHALRPDGTTYAKYDQYFVRKISGIVSAERSLVGGIVRPLVGLGFNYATVRDYSSDMVDATDGAGNTVPAREAPTRLSRDCANGAVVGCAGGFDNVLRLGVSLDTRDFEPDPNRGIYAELSSELASRVLGSDYEYARFLGLRSRVLQPLSRDRRFRAGGARALRGANQRHAVHVDEHHSVSRRLAQWSRRSALATRLSR